MKNLNIDFQGEQVCCRTRVAFCIPCHACIRQVIRDHLYLYLYVSLCIGICICIFFVYVIESLLLFYLFQDFKPFSFSDFLRSRPTLTLKETNSPAGEKKADL